MRASDGILSAVLFFVCSLGALAAGLLLFRVKSLYEKYRSRAEHCKLEPAAPESTEKLNNGVTEEVLAVLLALQDAVSSNGRGIDEILDKTKSIKTSESVMDVATPRLRRIK